MAKQLVADALIEEAMKSTKLDRFDSMSFREGLDILVADANAGERPDAGMDRLKADFVAAIATRLKITDYLAKRPELAKRPIEKPVFVFGVPRTGTTLLSNLLACDPERRSPLQWELDDPIPPATSATLKTDPRALARLEAEKKMLAARPDMGKFYRSSAIYPHEDVYIMSNDFKTLMWESKGKNPRYLEWIFSTDVTSAYEYHKRFLQVLQAEAPGVWNLKMPSHVLFLETLLKVYPDARLIWTHRDPYAATGSLCSIISLAHMGYMGRIDAEWLGKTYPWQAAQHADRGIKARERIGWDRIVDVQYAELMRDPLSTAKKVYKAMGESLSPKAEAAMRAWLADNPQDKFGKHEYKLAKYGLSLDTLKPMFERYLSRFDIELEA